MKSLIITSCGFLAYSFGTLFFDAIVAEAHETVVEVDNEAMRQAVLAWRDTLSRSETPIFSGGQNQPAQ